MPYKYSLQYIKKHDWETVVPGVHAKVLEVAFKKVAYYIFMEPDGMIFRIVRVRFTKKGMLSEPIFEFMRDDRAKLRKIIRLLIRATEGKVREWLK
mgnify:CR=1 FL=1